MKWITLVKPLITKLVFIKIQIRLAIFQLVVMDLYKWSTILSFKETQMEVGHLSGSIQKEMVVGLKMLKLILLKICGETLLITLLVKVTKYILKVQIELEDMLQLYSQSTVQK